MTSPASAQFPWSDVPEPPSGEFRSGRLPAGIGGDYAAGRGSRPGPALLLLVAPQSGYAAIHGLFRLVDVLDGHRLSGSLLVRLAGAAPNSDLTALLDPADALIAFDHLRPDWRELPAASYQLTGIGDVDRQAEGMAANSGAQHRYARPAGSPDVDAVASMAGRGRPAASLRMACSVDERSDATERVFQGLINMLRVAGMLEGHLAPVESMALQPPAYAEAPVSGYWSPAARPGQRIRINDSLGSFRDARGAELGDLVTNISGTLLGISHEIRVESGWPVAELARPLD